MAMRNESETPQPCKTCRMFFGYPETRNLCSFCYKTERKKEAYEHKTLDVADKTPLKINGNSNSVDIKKINRCQVCNIRAGLVPFGCRCGQTFCRLHRMPEDHACQFDFKAAGRVVLRNQNPVCVADKLETRI